MSSSPVSRRCWATRVREARNCGARKECRPLGGRQGNVMARKKKTAAMLEFQTVKRIDNSRLVRHVEPVKMRNYYRTVALGGIVAAFFMLYIYQHFRCIDLSFQLEDVRGRQTEAAGLNSSLKLEIASLRNPMRIDVIARRQLGLTEPLPTQVQEYDAPSGAEVAAWRPIRRADTERSTRGATAANFRQNAY